eukprot:4421244-Prymnesium_polylepis.1
MSTCAIRAAANDMAACVLQAVPVALTLHSSALASRPKAKKSRFSGDGDGRNSSTVSALDLISSSPSSPSSAGRFGGGAPKEGGARLGGGGGAPIEMAS